MYKETKQKGGLRWIFMIIIALVLASYFFNFSIKDVVEHEQTQENYEYVKENAEGIYQKHFSQKINYVWNELFMKFVWKNIQENKQVVQDNMHPDTASTDEDDISLSSILFPL